MKKTLMMVAWLAFAPWSASATEALRVDFVEPERYTDLGLSGSTTERIQTYVLGELERYLKDLAARSLPPSHTLHLTVFDLDMAGEYEPWRVPNLTNTRFGQSRTGFSYPTPNENRNRVMGPCAEGS